MDVQPWLIYFAAAVGRNGPWFNRFCGATFVGIGGLLAISRR